MYKLKILYTVNNLNFNSFFHPVENVYCQLFNYIQLDKIKIKENLSR